MGEWTITSLTEYLINLFITKNIVNDIIKKVDKLSHSLSAEEFLAIGVEQNGKDIKVILKVFDETKPKWERVDVLQIFFLLLRYFGKFCNYSLYLSMILYLFLFYKEYFYEVLLYV